MTHEVRDGDVMAWKGKASLALETPSIKVKATFGPNRHLLVFSLLACGNLLCVFKVLVIPAGTG